MPTLRLPSLTTAIALSAILLGNAPANVVLNGTFESGTSSWSLLGADPPNGIVEVSTIDPASGTNHARMSIDNSTNPVSPSLRFQQVLPVGSIDGTKLYDFSLDAKLDNNNLAGIAVFAIVHFLDQDASDGGGVKATYFNTLHTMGINNTYQNFSFTGLDPTAGADSVEIILQLAPGPIEGIQNAFNADNVVLQAQGGTTNPTPEINIEVGPLLTWTPTNPDSCYQPQSSPDGSNWTDLGSAFKGTTTTSIQDPGTASVYRVREIEFFDFESTVNGSFEIADDPCAENWNCLGTQAATRLLGDFNSGSASARLMVVNDATGSANTSEIQQNIILAGGSIVPGATYDFSFFAKQISSGVSYVQQFQLLWLDDMDNVIPGTGVPFKTFTGGSGSWTQITETGITAPSNAVTALIQIFGATGAVAGSTAHGEVLIDDVKLCGTAPVPSSIEAALNGGFETTDSIDPFCAESWVCTGTQAPNQWSVDPRTGSFSMALFIDDTAGPNQTSEASQDIAVAGGSIDPGKSYTLSFWANEIASSGSFTREYSVEWRDSGDTPLGGGIVATTFSGGNNTWQLVEAAPITAPANAATAVITLLVSTGPDAGPSGGEIRIDDLSFLNVVPPTTLPVTPASGVQLTWDTQAGSTYQPQCSTSLTGFANFGSPVIGDGNPASVTDTASGPRKFYLLDITTP